MTTIYILLVLIALIILHKIRANKRRNAVIAYCRSKGGIEIMYPDIIQGLLKEIKYGGIIEKTEYSITISNKNEFAERRFFFEQLYGGGLLIRYDQEAVVMGPIKENAIRKLWTFDETTPSDDILVRIRLDLGMATIKNLS